MTNASSSRGSSRSSYSATETVSRYEATVDCDSECEDYDDPRDEDWVPRGAVSVPSGPLRRSKRLASTERLAGAKRLASIGHHTSKPTQNHGYNTRSNKTH